MLKKTLTTKSMCYLALFAAIQIVLEYCTKIWEMPQGGNIAFSLVALFLCSYLMGPLSGLITSLVCLGLHFALGLAVNYGVMSILFDYVIPMVLVGLSGLIPLVHFRNLDIPISIIIVCILKTICHLISGGIAFETPLMANLAYNLPYNLGTMIACFVLFMILYPRLKKTIHL